jgi:hypothetical protein
VLIVTLGTLAPGSMAKDVIDLPPASREIPSPRGDYVFVVSTPDAWKSLKAKGELFRLSDGRRESVWSQQLPQEYGPRYALVGPEGSVLLVDEWIHVESRYAVMVVDAAGRVVAQHAFGDVQGVLDVPVAKVVKLASLGWWVTTPPVLDAERGVATIGAAGKVLGVRLSDGRLSIED